MSNPYKNLEFPLNVYAQSLYLQESQVNYLHYGLFKEGEVVQNVQISAVQQRATDLLLNYLPKPPCRILEIGLGLGTTTEQLVKLGYHITAITPSNNEINIAKQRLNDNDLLKSVQFKSVRFEDFVAPAESYDVILLQESAQYILPSALFKKAAYLLVKKGVILIADEVRLPHSDTTEHLPLLTDILQQAKEREFRLTEQVDLSKQAAPTVDYLLWVIEKHREALLADLELTQTALDDLLIALRRYQERYGDGRYGYRLLHFVKSTSSEKVQSDVKEAHSESDVTESHHQPTFTIRPYQPGDESAIQTSFAQVFPSYRTDETWHWIYTHNPDGARIMLTWADNGELAAHYACTVHQAICAGRTTSVGFIRDVFSTPRYRAFTQGRRGVFVQNFMAFLEKWTGQDKLVLLFGFPSKRPLRLGKLLMKYQPFSNWHYYRYTIPLQLSQHNPIGLIQTPEKFETAYDKLWEKRAGQYSFIICRSARFLNWRFIDIPHKKYWIWAFSAFLSPDVLGYVVITPNKPVAQLVDFCFPETPELAQSCWQQVVDILRWRGVKMLETWFSAAYPEKERLQKLGFKPNPRPEMITPVFRIFHPELDLQWTDAHFSYTMADSDLY
jgi:cyclopropane fatty-acyl-phospholipid synthase-like methyltransferase